MISAKIPRLALPLSILGLCMAQSAPWRPGTNSIPVRGVPQAVFYYPGDAGSSERPCILFAPGDGGWRGFATTVATQVAGWGYDVYGLDTKAYLRLHWQDGAKGNRHRYGHPDTGGSCSREAPGGSARMV